MDRLKAAVAEALKTVKDPHMDVGLPEMGMVRGVEVSAQGAVTVAIVYPCMGCPAYEMIQWDIKQRVGAVEGVSAVTVKIAWGEKWRKSDIAPAAREHVKGYGFQI
ncbi:MAG TPA: iron-sulfur cluster assembly protein [Alphaproteobacteria bacterium]|nr:iron-sulfur cluster assembly protein [Alphaproteobacteria bacterium]